MALAADPLVGRAAETALLDEAVSALVDGRGGALSVSGAAGIGKSRLLAELTIKADAAGHIVLAGAGSELERDRPFGVFVDALDEYLEGLDPRRLSRLPDDVRAELARVLPSFAGDSGATLLLQDERYRSHRAVRLLLETLAVKPLILVLDDFHWADSASIELAGALLRRPPAAPVLMVIGSRPRQLHGRLVAELGRAERTGTVTRVDVGPLDRAAAGQLLGPSLPADRVDALYEDSGGVPFYLEQLARVPARATQQRGSASTGIEDVPPMVQAALDEELESLPPATRLVLQGAAVAGDPFEPELAAAAAQVSEADGFDALDELLRLDFVRPTDVPRRFRFRHPLVRRAVYETTPGGWRLTAHERTAQALDARGAAPSTRAHHVERCARVGDLEAVALLRTAGEQAAGRAPGTAARWYAGALRLLPDAAPAGDRVGLLLPRAAALAAVGQLRESHVVLEECLELAPASEAVLHAQLVTTCSRVERLLGRHKRANERLERALAAVPDGSPEAVSLVIELAIDGFYRVELDTMEEWANRAVADAKALGDRPLLAAAHAMLTLAGAWTGKVEQAEAARAVAVPLFEQLTDAELATRLDAGANLAAAELYLDRFPDAAAHAERTLVIARSTGQGELLPPLNAVLGTCWMMSGGLAPAAELLDGAVEAARILDDPQGLAWTLLNRVGVAQVAGDLDLALTLARESVELTAQIEPGLVSAWCAVRLATVQLELGQPATAAELIVGSAGGEEVSLIPGGWRAMALETLTEARMQLGDAEGARAAAERASVCAAYVGLPFAASMADRAWARVEFAAGDFAAAAERSLAAVEKAGRAGALIDSELARILAGRSLAAAGERDRAIAELRTAANAFAACGAVRYRKEAEQELRKLGERTHHSAQATRAAAGDGFEALTDRELEIARLTVDRLTNREIAARLFLSEKTIETHMRNVFHKLGVTSRVQVARVTESADRAASP
jgi:ATP/maltotriose-dependent transcriptional regulator MalT